MLNRFFRKDEESAPIDEQIEAVLQSMTNFTPDSKEYSELLGYLERLNKLKTRNRRPPVSLDTWAIIAGNLLVTLVVVMYEQKHVLTTKAPSMIIKPKI